MNKILLITLSMLLCFGLTAQQKIIPLYQGKAPGSESWTWTEKETSINPMKMKIVYNVTTPSLTVLAPDPAIANGTSVIICPGGGFHVLNIDHEGFDVARALNKIGVTAFIFKYRVAQSFTDDPWQEMMSIFRDSVVRGPRVRPVIQMANDDMLVAMKYVRSHAAAYKLDTSRIGVIGFSAGGAVSRKLAHTYTPETKPAFAGIIYAGISSNANISIPADAPPLFIAAATDDILLPPMQNVELYKLWIAAKRSAELHLYATGGHGLRLATGNNWKESFKNWLDTQGFLKAR